MNAQNIPSDDEADRRLIAQAYRDLLRSFKTSLSPEDSRMIRSAFELAVDAHREQRRKSGEPYILHPIEVARICVEEIGLGPTAVACALLHDVVEDTEVKLPTIERIFGPRVALIVDGLTKLDSLHDSQSPQAENMAKVLRAMLIDVRVVLIKMADRLHNMRTIKNMPHHKQLKIAAETSYIYAPLAHRLGLYSFRSEFHDICLKITHPEEYHDIARKLQETKRSREQYIRDFIAPLRERLDDLGFPVEIHGRPKSIYSIWNKIKTKHVPFEGIYDLFAIRLVCEVAPNMEKPSSWMIYSVVTDYYKPNPERLKDWISNPKANGYESLHTTVVGPDGRFVEVQIRSKRMDEIAERGVAAHWKYKGVKTNANKTDVFETFLDNVRDTLESSERGNAVEMLADVQSSLFAEEVHVFTPKGELKILPEGATVLDFAFSIHSDVGCRCQAARVNNHIASISDKVHSGDQIEIITHKSQKPTEDWLKIVVTSKARTRIRAALNEEKRKLADLGKEVLLRKLNNFKVSFEENIEFLTKSFGYASRLDFLSAIHLEQVNLHTLKNFRVEGSRFLEPEPEKTAIQPLPESAPARSVLAKPKNGQKSEVFFNGESASMYVYSFANCCNPIQGDPIFAFLKTSSGAVIHRTTCPNAQNLMAMYAHRIMKADWGQLAHTEFVIKLIITGRDTGVGVITGITEKISTELGINIRSFTIEGLDGKFEGHMTILVQNADQAQVAMRALRSVEGVEGVSRRND